MKFFNIDVESQIIEMNINYETGSIDLKIANTKDIEREDDDNWLSEILYQNATTFGTVSQNKDKWNNISNVQNDVTELLNEKWDSAKREIVGGVNESVTINNQGITITDSNDTQRFIRMTNSVIGLTGDGGNTFRTAITPDGVYAERLIGRIIAGTNLIIENESGNYTIDDSGFTMNASNNDIYIDPSYGFEISRSGVSQFYTDTNGDITARGLRIIDSNGNSIIDASSSSLDLDNLVTINGNLTAANIDATNLEVDSANILGKLVADQIDTTGLVAEGIAVSEGDASIQTTIANKSGDDLPAITFFNDSAGYSISMIYSNIGLEIIGTNKLTLGGSEVATVDNLVAKFG